MKTTKWDFAEYLKTEKDMNVYLTAIFENGDYRDIQIALGNVARAKRVMNKIAKKNKLSRASLYKSLSKDGDPKLSTINKVANFLGYGVTFKKLKNRTSIAS